MDPSARVLGFCLALGLISTAIGGYQCIAGHTYSVAAQHEATTVGQIVGMLSGRGSEAYKYEFSVNGVRMNDYSEVCATPLSPDGCHKHGSVLVYYSYQPFPNSRLQDFAVASIHAYRIGKPVLAIGLPLLVLTGAMIAIQLRKDKGEDDSDPDDKKERNEIYDLPDTIHIVPDE